MPSPPEATPAAADDDPPPRRQGRWHRLRRVALLITLLLVALVTVVWAWMIRMPGRSHQGALPPLTAQEQSVRGELRRHVHELAVTIGERNAERPAALAQAGDYIQAELERARLTVEPQPFEASGQTFINYEAEIAAEASGAQVVVVGAHYDSARGTPAANDNASGVAALLVLAQAARAAHDSNGPPERTMRFVAFANEEPPHFQTSSMGSLVYAKRCREAGDPIVAMLSLETMGYYRDEPGTQSYPFPMSAFYPSVGNFVAFVGDLSSRDLVHEMVRSFRSSTPFPSEGAALPAAIPGVGWSDHWSFWQHGYPAVMVTDTAPFRFPHYHTPEDTPDQIDFDRLARVVAGLQRVIHTAAGHGIQ